MANTMTTSKHYDKKLSEEMRQQLGQLYSRFLQELRKTLDESELPPRITLFGQPHDAIIALDQETILVVSSKGTATSSASTEWYYDFSSKGKITPEEIMRSGAEEFGLTRMTYLRFNRSLLERSQEEQKKEFRAMSEKIVADIQKTRTTANDLGITEAITYLENARARFDEGGSTGYSDCKTNCRSAIVSLMNSLAGTDRIRDAVKKLHKEGLLGEREAEVIEALENLLAKIHDLASKKGAHPPLAEEDEALFTLKLTEAAVEYVIKCVEKTKFKKQ